MTIYVSVAAVSLACIAIALGRIGLFRNEPRQLSFMAIGLGFAAILMHYVFWMAAMICGILLPTKILERFDEIF